jgi:hypothetical protein
VIPFRSAILDIWVEKRRKAAKSAAAALAAASASASDSKSESSAGAAAAAGDAKASLSAASTTAAGSASAEKWFTILNAEELRDFEFVPHFVECNPWGSFAGSGASCFHWLEDGKQIFNEDGAVHVRFVDSALGKDGKPKEQSKEGKAEAKAA